MDFDACPGIAGPMGVGQYLQRATLETHGVVSRHSPLVLEAEDASEIRSRRDALVGGTRLGGGNAEPGVEPWQEVRQYSIGLL